MNTTTTPPPPDRKRIAIWKHHWRDEADAAFLYRKLAVLEPDAERKNLYRRFAEVEDRHADLWKSLLNKHGAKVDAPKPSLRARFLVRMAGIAGARALLPLLIREEGKEVKGYLALHRNSVRQEAKMTALMLARESAKHAEALGELSGIAGEPWHQTGSGGFLNNIVYGFNDGLTANFGLVAGIIGANVEPHIILVSGIAGLIADALSMGASGYLAAKSEEEVYAYEIEMEREEMRLMPEVEEAELALIYESRGIEKTRARQMAQRLMETPEQALEEKVREELHIIEAHTTPLKEGMITGVATAIGALIPVAPFFFLKGNPAIWTAFTIAMLSHLAVGAARSIFTGRGVIRSGIDMFLVGLGVAGVGYLIGELISKWLL
jgi:predicted membrane protein (TIGR00267 family)